MRLVPSAREPTKRKIYHGLGRDHSGSVDIGIDEKKVKKNKEGDYRGLGISLNHSMGSDNGVGAGDRVDKNGEEKDDIEDGNGSKVSLGGLDGAGLEVKEGENDDRLLFEEDLDEETSVPDTPVHSHK